MPAESGFGQQSGFFDQFGVTMQKHVDPQVERQCYVD